MPDIDIPNVVASTSFVGKTGAISATTLYTPGTAGLFRVSVYVTAPAQSQVGPSITLAWSDPNGAQSVAFTIPISGVSPSQLSFTQLMEVASGSISLSATDPNGDTYSVYVAVETL